MIRNIMSSMWTFTCLAILSFAAPSAAYLNQARSHGVVKQIVNTTAAAPASGPYSQAVRVGDTIYVSGTLGRHPATTALVDGVEGQTRQALDNIGEVLKAAGAGYGDVVKTTILLANIGDFKAVNEIYAEYFTANFPARSTYQVAALPSSALIEIEVVAVVGTVNDSPVLL